MQRPQLVLKHGGSKALLGVSQEASRLRFYPSGLPEMSTEGYGMLGLRQ